MAAAATDRSRLPSSSRAPSRSERRSLGERRLRAELLIALAIAACGGTATPIDAGPIADARADAPFDAGPFVCDGVDRACPAQLPLQGGACLGDLVCPYRELTSCGGGPSEDARCIDGRWSWAGFCLPGPVLFERCDAPETGPFPGVSLEVTEPTSVTWGTQGSAMIDVPFRITPGEDGPRCARATIALTFDGETAPYTHSIAVRCGAVNRVQEILPGYPCEVRPYAYALDVTIEGVGTQHFEGTLMGGPPMGGGPNPCGAFVDAGGADAGT